MNLNHLALPVPNIGAASAFFRRYFAMTVLHQRGEDLIVLSDEDGFAFTLVRCAPVQAPTFGAEFHIGFNVDSQDDLDEVHRRLLSDGQRLARPMGMLEGAMCFHCLAPGDVLVEVAFRG